MTPPNYFRFVRVDESGGGSTYGSGHTLQGDETFETSGWGFTNYSADSFAEQEDMTFDSNWAADNEWWT